MRHPPLSDTEPHRHRATAKPSHSETEPQRNRATATRSTAPAPQTRTHAAPARDPQDDEGRGTMTETTNGARSAGRKRPGKGVAVQRIFTTPGVHPYDEVTWERRDVVQQNWKSGETIFEQRGVEFPDFWSVNASTIVTTKYFRGALGSDVREQSLRQLIDRVVLTYAKAGREHGYFASDADAEVFEH